jgi:hypothetical protein
MDFECKYPLTQDKNNAIFAEWTKGYRMISLSIHDRTIINFENGLKYTDKDLVVQDKELGEVRIRFTQKPIQMDITVDGLHCTINKNHPQKRFKKNAIFFWVCAGFISIPIIFTLLSMVLSMAIDSSRFKTLLILSIFAATYGTIAKLIEKGKTWAFYAGIALVVINCILTMLQGSWFLLFWLSCLVYLLVKIPNTLNYAKHQKFNQTNDQILD